MLHLFEFLQIYRNKILEAKIFFKLHRTNVPQGS